MYRDQERYGNDPKVVVRAAAATFNSPMKWNDPVKVFTCSWSDWFIEQADAWRPDAWDIIRKTPHITYQILTKRPENILERLPDDWGNGWPNVWLGVSVESAKYHKRVIELSDVKAAVRFVSYEPALGPVDFQPALASGWIDWIVSGGESGFSTGKYQARTASLDWFRAVRNDCIKWGVPYFHKQHGGTRKINGTWGGRLLDGREWNDMPITAEKELTQ
jgi:protein gp37